MAIVQMSKINLFIHKEHKNEVLDLLQEKGILDVVDISQEEKLKKPEEEVHKFDFKLAEVEFALNFLKKDAPVLRGLEGMILGEKTKFASWKEVEAIQEKFDYQSVIEECKNIEEKINLLQNKIRENDEQIELLMPWRNLDLDLENDFRTRRAKLITGFLKKANVKKCLEEFEEDCIYAEVGIVSEQGEKFPCWFLVEETDWENFSVFLQKYEFVEVVLPNLKGTPAFLLSKLKKEKADCHEGIILLKKKKKELAQDVSKLKVIYDHLSRLKDKELIKRKFFYMQKTVAIQGFMPTQVLPELKKVLEKIDHSVVLEEVKITDTDNVPVKLQNNQFVKPFEGVMKLFGLPSKSEIDPTPYLTPFFLIFFGFCVTDAGYGLLLGAGIGLVLKFIKLPEDLKGMLRILMYGGWATFILGILFGGYFGMTPAQAPAWMVNADASRFKLQVFDPINNLNAVMGFAYGLGLIHLWLGTFLKGLNLWKKNKSEAIQTSFSYNLLIIFLIFLSLAKFGIFLPQLSDILEKAVYVMVGLAIWGSGYGQKNIIVRPLIGLIVFLQEVIGIFSSVLSYSRLFALGMSTGIIALVFNTIALTTFNLLPVFAGIPVMIFILLVGHLLNIVLNVLGAFIHSARLQFVEFFGKFLAGGGRDFVPFRREMKYVVWEKDFN